MNVLLLVKPGNILDGLNALLYAMPEIQLVSQSNDINSTLKYCQTYPVDYIIIEVEAGDQETIAKVAELKSHCRQGAVLVLLRSDEDRQLAEDSGADAVLSTEERPTKLKETIRAFAQTTSK